MGGLGNGRRGVRSPPLMIAALIACILVLGFNYWVSSSRNLELETKLYELEGQVRRGADEMKKKKEFEQATLQQNISSSAKTIQELKGQLSWLNDALGKLEKELQSCQGNINTLNNKLMYDMTQCNAQVLSQKELCNERVAAAKLEAEKKMQKLIHTPVSSQQENVGAVEINKSVKALSDGIPATASSQTPSLSQPKGNKVQELLTNEIMVDIIPSAPVEQPTSKDLSKAGPESVHATAALKQEDKQPQEGADNADEVEGETGKLLENNLIEDKENEAINAHEEDPQTEEADPGMEGMLIGQGKADETQAGQKPQEPEEYDADEQVVGGEDLEKPQENKQDENIGMCVK
ncbi:Golgi membrane protein 1 isoform X4 [Neolamprologus brichardi]|uniref:Golgi membrane protein 1 isoform X4 n=1 Tax=Neolamprologus brichardi TaxID=32507 RepID=UPI0003EC5F28|nr:Golgi membrane protein 1 isoform X4 [Neolamprologus brichardi]